MIGYWGGGWGGYGAGYWGNSYYDSGELSCFRSAWQDKLGAAAPHVVPSSKFKHPMDVLATLA